MSRRNDRKSKPKKTETVEKKHHHKRNWHDKIYKKLLIIPLLLLLFAIVQVSMQVANTGDFLNKDISLKGGISITVPTDHDADIEDLKEFLASKGHDVNVRNMYSQGKTIAVLIESSTDLNDQEAIDALLAAIVEKIPTDDYSIEGFGSSIGASFFTQALKSLLAAFIIMGFVVFLFFGESLKFKIITCTLGLFGALLIIFQNGVMMYVGIGAALITFLIYARYSLPSVAVIGAAFSDILVTLAIVNLLGFEVSSAGLAAFLMLIGYSVDTDILLTTRLLKRNDGSVNNRLLSAMKTGMFMNGTTLIALLVALIFTSSDVIAQIMTILIIGLLVDQVNTWIQNAGILKWYVEAKHKKN